MAMRTARFTKADYDRLPEGFPAQLIDGALVKEAAPIPWHQWVLRRLANVVQHVVGEDRILFAPIDLAIDDENVFQPDLVVFDEPPEMGPHVRAIPMPILVAEILSDSTASHDLGIKARRYLEVGVRELWLVDPIARTIEVCTPGGSTTVRDGGTAISSRIPGLRVEVAHLLRW